MKGKLIGILNMTAWRMEVPKLFGGFHITAAFIAAAIAVAAALFAAHRVKRFPEAQSRLSKILAVTGWILFVLEIYKQIFIYCVINEGVYDWWYFPFQLCSVPMYLCILLPFLREKIRAATMTFMGGYTFVSAVAALVYPEDLLRPYVSLTLHGFIWHGLLLFISLLILFTGSFDASLRGLLNAAVLFSALCVIALCINIYAEPLMQNLSSSQAGFPHSYAAMFYLNPYHISPQPLVSNIQSTIGIPLGLMLYAFAIAVSGSAIGRLLSGFLGVDVSHSK